MKIPKKITPDYLKETLVEIRFIPNISQELIPGVAMNILSEIGFSYIQMNAHPEVNIPIQPNQQLGIGFGNNSGCYIRDEVRLFFLGDQISFNCLEDKYVGWDNYFLIIKKVTDLLVKKDLIRSFNRVSIRYISEFPGVEILKEIQGEINIEKTRLTLDNAILRLVDGSENTKTFVAFTNKVNRVSPKTNEKKEVSLIDINVFENFENSSGIEVLWEKLNYAHAKQKETFFSMISDSFLKTLNPEY